LAEAGKPCYEINSNERGENTTLLACFNALGKYEPLMFIFKGSRTRAEHVIGSPVGSIIQTSPKAWNNSSLFIEFGQSFVNNLPKDDARPHILLMDGHGSHVYNLKFMQLMKENNVYPVCFPPHTTHYLQPADRCLFKSLKHNWNIEGRLKLRDTGGRKLTKAIFSKFLGRLGRKRPHWRLRSQPFDQLECSL